MNVNLLEQIKRQTDKETKNHGRRLHQSFMWCKKEVRSKILDDIIFRLGYNCNSNECAHFLNLMSTEMGDEKEL